MCVSYDSFLRSSRIGGSRFYYKAGVREGEEEFNITLAHCELLGSESPIFLFAVRGLSC